jgi:DNA-directed RNA polymerase specialized sigma24 family protein
MGQDNGDRDERPGSTPEPFEVFYLREYPKVVGLLHGLLGSRLVAEELAQETGARSKLAHSVPEAAGAVAGCLNGG